jgi:DNA-binding NarL/FixJ family response regulator
MSVRILIGDADETSRRELGVLLQRPAGFIICAEAVDARQAVVLATGCKPDVAVIDLSLPMMGGVETTRQIRRASRSTEVVVVSDGDDDDLIDEALRAGARAYLLKREGDLLIAKVVATLARRARSATAA